MFIGIQNNIPCFVGKTHAELENLQCVHLDEIRQVDFAQMYNGKIYLNETDLIVAKQDFIRSIRNSFLEQYVDAVVSNPLRWEQMVDDEKSIYINYRQYLLDYTKQDNWYESSPKTLDAWKE